MSRLRLQHGDTIVVTSLITLPRHVQGNCASGAGSFPLVERPACGCIANYRSLTIRQRAQHRFLVASARRIGSGIGATYLRTNATTREDRPMQRRTYVEIGARSLAKVAGMLRLLPHGSQQRHCWKEVGGLDTD